MSEDFSWPVMFPRTVPSLLGLAIHLECAVYVPHCPCHLSWERSIVYLPCRPSARHLAYPHVFAIRSFVPGLQSADIKQTTLGFTVCFGN